jgi:hypothetical protein
LIILEVMMFRLVKLAAYFLLGYAIYEFVAGMLQIEDENFRRRNSTLAAGSRPQRPSDPENSNFIGPGEGQAVSTLEPDGATAAHRVGRGAAAR